MVYKASYKISNITNSIRSFLYNPTLKLIMEPPLEKSREDLINWFEDLSENAPLVQTHILKNILQLNSGAEYLKKWLGDVNFDDVDQDSLESVFASLVPLASHSDLEPYIHRIADGDTSPLLTQQPPIITLSLSSGTTEGRQKYVPFTSHSSKTTLHIFSIAAAYRSRAYPIKEGGRILEFIYSSKRLKTKGGLNVGTATTHYYASEEFKIKQKNTKSFTCSPEEVISSGNYKESTYCHLLLGLFFSDQVEFITSTFAYSIIQAFRSFEELYKELCEDIKNGTVSSSRITNPKVRHSVLQIISANPNLGSEIEAKCKELEDKEWIGVIPKLWPNAKYVYSIMTGSMQPYLKKLRHYAGDLDLVSADYGSTESWIGVNVDPTLPPEDVTFAVVPNFAYFEFIPLYKHSDDLKSRVASVVSDDFIEGQPLPLSKVKVGQRYEVVLTTFTGLYRYRLGDVVEVSGFHKNTPKLNFICRRKLILTVTIDKNTENDLQLVVEKASQVLASQVKAELVDFTSHAYIAAQPGHYIIYWEVKGEVNDEVYQECCSVMDSCFVDHGYVVARRTNSIGPLELRVVGRGTFKKILDHFLGNGAALSQFKTPRCTNNKFLLNILDVCTVKRFYSTSYQGT